jgi:transglutaminase-like putative cysteine protease
VTEQDGTEREGTTEPDGTSDVDAEGRIYRIVHRTSYRYPASASRCRNEAHLRPRDTPHQRCLASDLVVDPRPASWSDRSDYFGNPVVSFAVDGPFDELTVTATSSVAVNERAPWRSTAEAGIPTQSGSGPTPVDLGWQETRDHLSGPLNPEVLAAREFCFESPLVSVSPEVRAYAEPTFGASRSLFDVITELTERIFTDFAYDPGFTTITTPLQEVLRYRRGVCQDFAHLAIGCFRSMGLAARYVSGYLETTAPVGEQRLVGADASHAWPSVFVPGWGWLDVDPTNDKIVGSTYVTTAWGRDYSDVTPLKGIVFGGGDSHHLDVSVDVTRS